MEKFGINKGYIYKYIIFVKKCKYYLDKDYVGVRFLGFFFYYGFEFKYCFYFNDSNYVICIWFLMGFFFFIYLFLV